MKQFLLGMSGAALAVFAAGCGPELAQVTAGADDLEWKEFAASSYSGYRPPRVTSPAEKDKYQNEVNPAGAAADPVAPAEDPAPQKSQVVVEEEKPAVTPAEKQETKEAVTEEKPAVTPAEKQETREAVTEEKPAEQPKEVPADKKEADKTADKPAEQTAAAPAEDAAVGGEVYTVQAGDTLSGLAKKFYKDGNLSGIIFKANSKVLKNPNALRPGMKLVIPKM